MGKFQVKYSMKWSGQVLLDSLCPLNLNFYSLGIALLDFGLLMAKDLSMRRGMKVKEVWMDPKPAKTMRLIACSVICCLWGSDTPQEWPRITERVLEKRFGRLRSSFSNAAMSVSDYWRSSFNAMKKELKVWQENGKVPQASQPERLSQNSFCSIASRAFWAALKLSSMCSGQSKGELQAAFNVSLADGGPDAGYEDDEQDAGLGASPSVSFPNFTKQNPTKPYKTITATKVSCVSTVCCVTNTFKV